MTAQLLTFWPELTGIFLCLLACSFFSAAKAALAALSEARIQQLLESHPRQARLLRLWLEQGDALDSTLVLGNSLSIILAAGLATYIGSELVLKGGPWWAIGLITLFVLLGGQVAPRALARRRPERIALGTIRLVRLIHWLMFPVRFPLIVLANGLVRLISGAPSATDTSVTEQDIEFMIDLGQREGVLEEHEEKMLHSVLELSDTQTRAVMVPRTNMLAVPIDMDRETLLRTMIESGYSRVPVYDGSVDSIVGLIHAKDLLREAQLCNQETFDLKKILRPVYYVPQSMKISVLLKEFQRRKTHLAIVVDEYGGTAGIVAMEDIIEEIVGEIQDEYDVEEKQFRRIGDGRYLVDARMPVDELGEQLGVEFPEDESYETLGGFVIALHQRLPVTGDREEWQDLIFIIREADEKRVNKIEVQLGRPLREREGAPAAAGASAARPGEAGGKEPAAGKEG